MPAKEKLLRLSDEEKKKISSLSDKHQKLYDESPAEKQAAILDLFSVAYEQVWYDCSETERDTFVQHLSPSEIREIALKKIIEKKERDFKQLNNSLQEKGVTTKDIILLHTLINALKAEMAGHRGELNKLIADRDGSSDDFANKSFDRGARPGVVSIRPIREKNYSIVPGRQKKKRK